MLLFCHIMLLQHAFIERFHQLKQPHDASTHLKYPKIDAKN